jgi:hypothetical protein
MRVTLIVRYANGERTSSTHADANRAISALAQLANVAHTARVASIELRFGDPEG